MPPIPSRSPVARRTLGALAGLLVARLVFHALFVPAFEGPDEPFHLGRAEAVARAGWRGLGRAAPLAPEIQRAVARNPCGPDLGRAFGCPRFPGSAGAMRTAAPIRDDYPNYENNQPPLYYAIAAAGLAASKVFVPFVPNREPEDDLRRLRILSAAFVAIALFGPLRSIARRRSEGFALLGMAAMFLPGFSEALVRASNDALLFLWTAAVVDVLMRDRRGPLLPVFFALGCLIKLNALPVLAFAVVLLWRERRRALSVVSTVAAVLPALLLGASTWGGAVKIAKRIPHPMPAGEVAAGLARSLYTIFKGAAWMGEWSFFRPPVWLLATGVLLGIAIAAGVRPIRRAPRLPAHAAGIAVALAGTVAFILTDRRVFGSWAGVGGWYVWGWAPWLAVAAGDLLEPRRKTRWIVPAAAAYVLLMNVCWFVAAGRLYGRSVPREAAAGLRGRSEERPG